MKINRPRNFDIDEVIQGKRLCTSCNRCNKCRRVLLEESTFYTMNLPLSGNERDKNHTEKKS